MVTVDPPPLVLVVCDDVRTDLLLRDLLSDEGWLVTRAAPGAQARQRALETRWDLLAIDVEPRPEAAAALVRHLRSRGRLTPILVLTARTDGETAAHMLDLGADDAVHRPIFPTEFRARCRALVRRSRRPSESGLAAGPLRIDPASRRAQIGTRSLDLTPREFDLLETLVRFGNRPVGRDLLHRRIWGIDFDPGTKRVEVLVFRLRRRLAEVGERVEVVTVRGAGYRLDAEGG